MNHLYKKLVLTLFLSGLFLGCGNSSEDDIIPTTPVISTTVEEPRFYQTGVFIDSAVSGLTYSCSSINGGITNNLGEFTCEVGDRVSFILGSKFLGEVNASKIITPLKLFNYDEVAALNFSRLVQTLDEDNNLSNGITINNTTLTVQNDINFSSLTFDQDITTVLRNNYSLVSKEQALLHLKNSFSSLNIYSDGSDINETVNIINNTPVIVSEKNLSFFENNTSSVVYIKAIDLDEDSIIYSISENDADSFNINSSSGEVVFKNAPNFELKSHYIFTATASDGSSSYEEEISVTIIDVPETVPIIIDFNISLIENTAIGTVIGDINITDSGDTNITGFTLSDTTNFEIDSLGYIRTKTVFDFTITPVYNLRAYATNAKGNSEEVYVNITIIDPTIPIFLSPANVSVVEGQTDALSLVTQENTSALFYSISGGDSDSFSIDSSTGIISFLQAPEFFVKSLYTFIVTIVDASGNEVHQNAIIKVTIAVNTTLKKTAQLKSYDSLGEEVLDISVKDDGYYQSGISPSFSRTSDIVSDNITNLMWQDDSSVKTLEKQWLLETQKDICDLDNSSDACYDTSGDTAQTYCQELELGEYTDWRVPTFTELEGLINYANPDYAIDDIFENIHIQRDQGYWSSTTSIKKKHHAWYVNFSTGDMDYIHKAKNFSIRCVREIN